MKLNQRSDNIAHNQNLPRSVILDKYKNHIEHLIQDTELSFDSIETPGWTSLVNTEQSKVTMKKNQPNASADTHIQILNRLNSLPKLKTINQTYNNIKLNPLLGKHKNVIVYGSVKIEEKGKKIIETPKSRNSHTYKQQSNKIMRKNESPQPFHQSSNKKHNNLSLSNKFLNRFNKPDIFYSVGKPVDSNLKSSRKRVSSVRSQPSENLKEQIKQRLSMGNYKPKIDSNFDNNICTEPNEKAEKQNRHKDEHQAKFYSQIHAPNILNTQKNEYFTKYMNKLNQRTRQTSSVKVFKKHLQTQLKHKLNPIEVNLNPIKEKQNTISTTAQRRFNAITVHDHLYQDHMRLESKKNMYKIIDDSYKKATTLTFTPLISEMSCFIAQSKFQRQSIGQNSESNKYHCIDNCFKHQKQNRMSKHLKGSIFKIQEQVSMRQKERMTDKLQNRTLNKLFLLLSNNSTQITEKTLESNIEKLPLALLQLLEPFLTQVYKKHRFFQKQFIKMFEKSNEQNDNNMLFAKRQVIIVQTERFLKVLNLKEKDKENIMDNNLVKEFR